MTKNIGGIRFNTYTYVYLGKLIFLSLNTVYALRINSAMCHPLLIFANIFDSEQAQQVVLSYLYPNCLTLLVFMKTFSEKNNFEKSADNNKKACRTIHHAIMS